ncbi:DUF5304 family protein [Streptomyces johnsoniae]|uniref:DUF5304 family protein n=1 Tax=Streptomyces johnsoniae TaxID=3075532 RepID=A0ABU2S513_9ACTN|nr:DUF5304 family protein [Streptomyces sp. DSM 41886]MDT0444073.1 DUF5304 family protein [Streptomyces sp. DSM 41886]
MSNTGEHPAEDAAGPERPRVPGSSGSAGPEPDPDAWAAACEEDLAAERDRRRREYGEPTGDAADELRKLADAVAERLGHLGAALGSGLGPAAGLAAGPLAERARAAFEPVIERNADVIQHLAGAGQELLAAYRAAVLGQEQRWSRPQETADPPDRQAKRENGENPDDPEAPPGSQRIDLD